tara:strand:+ start:390 stop:782 length:393 start_codon:yes stop_codon:yes gene_type:complete
MTEAAPLKTNHNVRIVTLTTGERVLTMFGEVRDDEQKVVGYRLVYPYLLALGDPQEDGNIPIHYTRWCPFSPIEEHRMSGEHIISVVFPDNNILDNFIVRLKEYGLTEEQIFFEEETNDGTDSEPSEAAE